MGQCTSNKAKSGNLNIKKVLSHKKPKKMDKHKQFREIKEDEHKESNKPLNSNKKPPQKYTKGVAMSFGFKRRPTPMAAHNSSMAWDDGISITDSNGNKDEPRHNFAHKTQSSERQSHSITPKPSRMTTTEQRTNKVADIKHSPLPLQFSAKPLNKKTSPNLDSDHSLNRTFTRNVTIVTKTEVFEEAEMVKSRHAHKSGTGEMTSLQTGKFTFQTTRLPQPEPIRVIETKTAKTIANNNKRSARIWRNFEPVYDDSGFSSNTSGVLGENVDINIQNSRKYSLLENSDSFSDACTPPPLPELPSIFNLPKNTDTNKDKVLKNTLDERSCKKTFLKSNSALVTSRHLLDRDSPQSSSDQEWISGGEALADDVSLTLSPQLNPRVIKDQVPTKKSTGSKPGTIAETVLKHALLKPSHSFEMIESLKESMNLSLSDEDPNFAAVVANNNTAALLDDEILSPVESLLSSSENEDLMKKKMARSSSNSKDINEKLTPSPPGTPSNATYSLSLSDDKEDFLIDDEIADQPELVFEKGNTNEQPKKESMSTNKQQDSFLGDFSPLPLRKKRQYLQDTNQGSFDSLSPCDSIGSEDLIMDCDISQTNDLDLWDRQSEPFPSPKFNRKRVLINGAKTNSPSSLKSSHRSSPDSRSPKKSNFCTFGYQSMMYDPSSESLTLTKANHSAIQQDIIGIKTMLITLKRVLNESESHDQLKSCTEESYFNSNNNNNEFRLELADLKRQVIFLQGQLEDKEKTVSNLQRQIEDLAIQDNRINLPLEDTHHNRCNAATQTERTRPLSSGVFSLTTSPIDDNNPILRLMVK